MIITIRWINATIPSYNHLFVCIVRTFKIHSLNNFQVYNSVLLIIAAMMYVKSLELTHLRAGSLCPFKSLSSLDCLFSNPCLKFCPSFNPIPETWGCFFFYSWMFQHLSLKWLFSIVLPLLLCQRSVDCIYVHLFLVSCSFFCQYHSLDYCNFVVLKSGSIQFLFFSFVLAILYLFLLYINFRISLSVSTE